MINSRRSIGGTAIGVVRDNSFHANHCYLLVEGGFLGADAEVRFWKNRYPIRRSS